MCDRCHNELREDGPGLRRKYGIHSLVQCCCCLVENVSGCRPGRHKVDLSEEHRDGSELAEPFHHGESTGMQTSQSFAALKEIQEY